MNAIKKTILVVDTEPEERRTIGRQLASRGYDIAEASDEREIFQMMGRRPMLVLLDILAPGMDGIQVCRRLKADSGTRDIPVVFLTSDTNAQTLEMVYEAGGADYVEKPVIPQVLFARVETHRMLRDRQLQSEDNDRRVARLNHEKNQLLIDADRLGTLGFFSSACAHEINNPISYIMGNAELAKYAWQAALPIVERHLDEDDSGYLKKSAGLLHSKLDYIIEGAERVSRKVREFRNFSQKPDAAKKDCRLADVLDDAASLLLHRLKQGYKIQADVSREVKIYAAPQKLSQAFVNLFSTAMDTMAPEKGTVSIGTLRNNGRVEIRVKGHRSCGRQGSAHDLFRPAECQMDGNDKGLGLFVAQCIIEDHNGEIHHGGSADSGAQFDIYLPAAMGSEP